MSDKKKRLVQLLRQATAVERLPLFNAEVKSVEGDSCTVLYGDLELDSVRLKATIDGDKSTLLLVPKVGTMVTIGSFTEDFKDLCVLRADALESVALKINTKASVQAKELVIEAESTVLNNGALGGVPKVEKLVEELNELKDDINSLKNVFSAWAPVPNDGGAALKAAVATWMGAALARASVSEIENNKFKH